MKNKNERITEKGLQTKLEMDKKVYTEKESNMIIKYNRKKKMDR